MPPFDVILDRVRPVGAPITSRAPVFKTIGYTLDISARFLAAHLVGRSSIALADKLLASYWRRILRSGNCRLLVGGRENIEAHKPYVVMSNHSSLLDIPAMMGAFPGSLRMVTKEELTKIPIWGQALVASGFVPVDRGNREKAIAQLEQAKRNLDKGVSVWISPEGTRSRDRTMGPFKKGGFHVALDLGVPIIPTYIDGAAETLPPDQFKVRYDRDVVVRFGPPIQTAGRDKAHLEELMAETRAAITALM